ncbi:hypothetical protein Gotur_034128, partial [Gossypium turneri]
MKDVLGKKTLNSAFGLS